MSGLLLVIVFLFFSLLLPKVHVGSFQFWFFSFNPYYLIFNFFNPFIKVLFIFNLVLQLQFAYNFFFNSILILLTSTFFSLALL
jgi:hypothetical protein